MASYTPKSILNRFFILTWCVALFLQVTQNLFSNIISVYVVDLGYSNTFAGLQALIYSIFAIAARFLGSYLCDFKSRRICTALGCATFAGAALLFGIPAFAVPIAILLLRGMQGFGYSLGQTGYFSTCVDVTPKEKVSLGLGLNLTAQGVAQLVGGVLAVALVIGSNYNPVFIVAAISAVVAMVFAAFCNYEKKYSLQHRTLQEKKMTLTDFLEPKVYRVALLVIVYYFSVALCMIFTVAAAKERGIENGALFFTTASVGMVIGNVGIVKVAERFGRIKTMVPVCIIAAGCSLSVAFHQSMSLLLVGGFLYGLSLSTTPVIQSAAVEDLPFERRGSGTATIYLAMDLTLGVGPLIWGMLIDGAGYKVAFVLGAIIYLATIILLPFTLKKPGRG